MVSQIKIARVSKGWTQKQLADEIDVDTTAISRLENRKPVLRSTLNRACKALGIDPENVTDVVVADRSGAER